MTLDTYTIWHNTRLKECLADNLCVPYDQGLAWCRYDGAKARLCSYTTCPRRRYYKTDGMVTVTQSGSDATVILWDEALRIKLTPDRVRFLGKALTELSEKLDAEKGVTV